MSGNHLPQRSQARGRLYQGVAIGLGVVVGLPLLAVIAKADGLERASWGLLAFVIGTALALLHEYGGRHLLPTADEVMASDTRAPVLYLRAFEDDDEAQILEYSLAEVMQDVGPFVAVGRPGDKLPPLGASRSYQPDDNWQSYVLDLLDRAVLVVMLAGRTQGLQWELRQCAKRIEPHKLVLLVPNERASYEGFEVSARNAGLPLTLPPFPDRDAAPHEAANLSGLVYFDRSWRGEFSGFPRAFWVGTSHEIATSSTRAKERIRLALKPVVEAAGLPIRMPRTNYPVIVLLGCIAFVVISLVIVVGWLWKTGALS
jgi:hypothetical protein